MPARRFYDRAVVTSTLVLLRSMGMALGITARSLVMRTALIACLDQFARRPGRGHIIRRVRGSVAAFGVLDAPYQEQGDTGLSRGVPHDLPCSWREWRLLVSFLLCDRDGLRLGIRTRGRKRYGDNHLCCDVPASSKTSKCNVHCGLTSRIRYVGN